MTSYDLDRFVDAQAGTYETALAELRAGRKRTHWMWFVFPQMRGLGASYMAQRYGIASRGEARAYLDHPVLGARLRTCTQAVLACGETSLHAIFGSPDDMKFNSSMTLFALVGKAQDPFDRAIAVLCGGREDERTRLLLDGKDV